MVGGGKLYPTLVFRVVFDASTCAQLFAYVPVPVGTTNPIAITDATDAAAFVRTVIGSLSKR